MSVLDAFMAPQTLQKRHQKVDPNNLPWGSPDPSKVRKPATTPEELSRLTGISPDQQATYLAANAIPPLGEPGGPVAEDLAQTIDVQITDAIRDLAENQLNDDPVAIYNWVRNNIEFIPSYGSIQGADYTLQHGKGNAFDTASLLIALFRASNIPARYAYGTIEVPVDQAMNWVGGVDVPEAAQQLLGQGGIPNTAIISGGQITHIRMEHVWVEAWIDYFPSRGAKHAFGDQWLPLDPSFKQYEFVGAVNSESIATLDLEDLIDQSTQSATINNTEGFIEGLDLSVIETAMIGYQQQVDEFISNQNPGVTLDDILGSQRIIIQEYQELVSGLPYKLVARTHNYAELPNELRHRFRFTLGTEHSGNESERLMTFEQSLPELAGKKHILTFKPTSEVDEQLLNNLLPEPDSATGEIDVARMPTDLPGYLINLTAEFTQDGVVVERAPVGEMGRQLFESLALWSPALGWNQSINHISAGETKAIGLDLQGNNPQDSIALLAELRELELIGQQLTRDNVSQLSLSEWFSASTSTLYTVVHNYFLLNNILTDMIASSSGIVHYRLPSYGLFGASLQTIYFFGLPRSVSTSGLSMDIESIRTQDVAKSNDQQTKIDYLINSGYQSSALEHIVPERLFSSFPGEIEAVSAVKALEIASSQGQTIWTVGRENLNEALSLINLSDQVELEIRNAVLSGKIVTVHEQPIVHAGTTSTGFVVIDPLTGHGAYLIEGGANGAFIAILGTALVIAFGLALFYLGPIINSLFGFAFLSTAFGFIALGAAIMTRTTAPNTSSTLCSLSIVLFSAALGVSISYIARLGQLGGNVAALAIGLAWTLYGNQCRV